MKALSGIEVLLALIAPALSAQRNRTVVVAGGGGNIQQTTDIINDCERRTNKLSMRTWNMGGDAESEWSALRAELNRLATTFNLPHIR